MPYYKFEKLKVWKLARQFTNVIYEITKLFPDAERYGLTQQIRRSSFSVILNIAEGSAKESDPDFIRFLRIAKGSLEETVSGTYLALDLKYINKKQFNYIYNSSHIVAKKLNALIKSLKK